MTDPMGRRVTCSNEADSREFYGRKFLFLRCVRTSRKVAAVNSQGCQPLDSPPNHPEPRSSGSPYPLVGTFDLLFHL